MDAQEYFSAMERWDQMKPAHRQQVIRSQHTLNCMAGVDPYGDFYEHCMNIRMLITYAFRRFEMEDPYHAS